MYNTIIEESGINIILEHRGTTTVVSPQETNIIFSQSGIKGDRGEAGIGLTPTTEELQILDYATIRKEYVVTTRHASSQRELVTFTDADGYTNHTATYGINGTLQFTTIRREFDFGGEHWIYEIEHLWTVDGHNGIQINEFSRT